MSCFILCFLFLMIRVPQIYTRTDTLCPYPTLFRSDPPAARHADAQRRPALRLPRRAGEGGVEPEPVHQQVRAGRGDPHSRRPPRRQLLRRRSEEHTSELQSLMRISYAVFCLKKKNRKWVTI